jgi:hypothetical protein
MTPRPCAHRPRPSTRMRVKRIGSPESSVAWSIRLCTARYLDDNVTVNWNGRGRWSRQQAGSAGWRR